MNEVQYDVLAKQVGHVCLNWFLYLYKFVCDVQNVYLLRNRLCLFIANINSETSKQLFHMHACVVYAIFLCLAAG